jgi:hypothetical protein
LLSGIAPRQVPAVFVKTPLPEINQFRTADGESITTNTGYNTYNSRPITQNISVTEPN